MWPPKSINIDPLSGRSLYLELEADGKPEGTATGFIVMHADRPYLITNRHVVDGETAPNEVVISHHAGGRLGVWVKKTEFLRENNGTPLWIEHPRGSSIDVIALPLKSVDNDIDLYPFDLSLADADLVVTPAMPVSIIGFIGGISQPSQWPIWKTGHIATDHDVDYNGLPKFLIDATTRPCMSGSPVVVRLSGGFSTKNGSRIFFGSIATTRFLGIYSDTPSEGCEIGSVWRPHIITEILESV